MNGFMMILLLAVVLGIPLAMVSEAKNGNAMSQAADIMEGR